MFMGLVILSLIFIILHEIKFPCYMHEGILWVFESIFTCILDFEDIKPFKFIFWRENEMFYENQDYGNLELILKLDKALVYN